MGMTVAGLSGQGQPASVHIDSSESEIAYRDFMALSLSDSSGCFRQRCVIANAAQ
jgi:hypothetical protein